MTTATISPTSVKLDNSLKLRIQNLAKARQRSIHWLMVQAIQEFVDREEKQELFMQEARDSWMQFQQTGLHLTGTELFSWLDSWANNDSEPECHS